MSILQLKWRQRGNTRCQGLSETHKFYSEKGPFFPFALHGSSCGSMADRTAAVPPPRGRCMGRGIFHSVRSKCLVLFSLSTHNDRPGYAGTLVPNQKTGDDRPLPVCEKPDDPWLLTTLAGEALLFGSANIFCWMLLFFCINHLFFLFY